MAGIFGCRIRNNNSQTGTVCSVLQRHALTGFPHQSEYKAFDAGTIGLGYASRQSSPDAAIFSSTDDNFLLILSGELFLPSGEQLNAANFQNEFIPSFKKRGKEFFLDCDGAFVLALYDVGKKLLYLITDPFGNLALHYGQSEDGFFFSFQQKGLAEVLRSEMDDLAIGEIIALGQRLNGKTMYKNIFRLAPASFLRIDKSNTVSMDKYFAANFEVNSDTKENLRHIEESFLRSADVRTRRSNILVGLSGGLDSRMTLAAIKKIGRINDVTVFTHGLPDSGDIAVASQISTKYQIPHLRIIFDEDFFKRFPQYWRESINLSEGILGIENAINITSWQVESERFKVVLDSHAGALYRRQFHKAREGYLRRSGNFSKTFFEQFATPLFRSELLLPELCEAAAQTTISTLTEYFSSQPENLDTGDKIDLYYLEQMCANKYSLSGNAQLNFVGLSHPLLSLNAYIASRHIPARQRKKNVIYRYLFHRFAPELKYIRADDSGYPVPYFGYRAFRYAAPLLERGLQLMPEYFRRFSLRKPVITRLLIGKKNIRALKEILLERRTDTVSIFRPDILEKKISDFEKGKNNAIDELMQAANLQLLLEYFARS